MPLGGRECELDLAGQHQVEAVAGVALVEHHAAPVHVLLAHAVGEAGDLGGTEAAEERYVHEQPAQAVGFGVLLPDGGRGRGREGFAPGSGRTSNTRHDYRVS